jgi:hypothetical protein
LARAAWAARGMPNSHARTSCSLQFRAGLRRPL